MTITLHDALEYHGMGLAIVPATAKKAPKPKGWDRYQHEQPTEGQVRKWFGGDDQPALGIVLGKASMGGLLARDFDTMESYERWAADHRTLAITLPTTITPRGRHVYARADIDVAHRLMGTTILGAPRLTDGELRAGGICIAPQSRHPAGHVYTWQTPISADIPLVDIVEAGLMPTEHRYSDTQDTDTQDVLCDCVTVFSDPKVFSDQIKTKIKSAIDACLPPGPGYRGAMLFALARKLKSIPGISNFGAAAFREFIVEWHGKALERGIRTKEFSQSWADWHNAWEKSKYAEGEGPLDDAFQAAVAKTAPKCAEQYDHAAIKLLVSVCRELSRRAGGAPFYLSCRAPAERLGVNHVTVNGWLNMLVGDGVLRLVKKGDQVLVRRGAKFGRSASEFHYTGGD